MSNNLDLQQEGFVETYNSIDASDSDGDDNKDPDSSPDLQQTNNVIQSNISNVTDDGKDSASDNDNTEQDVDNESATTSGHTNSETNPQTNNNSDEVKNNDNPNPNPPNPPTNFNFIFHIFCSIIVIFIAIYIRKFMQKPDPSIPICSKIPDPSFKPKLQCPKCDAYDNNGKCIIYVPYSAQKFSINAKDATLNDYPCTHFTWDLNSDHILADGENTPTLHMLFISPGREDIEFTVSINRTDHNTGQVIYYTEKTCDIQLVIYQAPFFGIDLGTTYSCIAYQKPHINTTTNKRDTNIVVMDETKMEYCIPSSVYFGVNNSIYVGNTAQKMAMLNNDYNNLIYDIKRIIGRPCDDPVLKVFDQTHQFSLNMTGPYPSIIIPNWSQDITPEQLLAAMLVEMVKSASQQFGVPALKDVVVSIPAIFHDAQRKAVHTACEIAGLNVKLLLVEPSSASIAHIYYARMEELREFKKYFMTLDVGGGTTDVSVLRCPGLYCEVLGVAGNSSLGGIDFDNVIVDIMVDKILLKNKNLSKDELINTMLYDEILSVAESVKKALSTENEYMVRLQNDKDNKYQPLIITRKEFEQHPDTVKLVNCIIKLAKKAMYDDNPLSNKKGNEHLTNIKAILLIGGTVKIPLVQEMLMNEFVETQLIYPDEDPQLMVVVGSAIIGGSMAYTDSSNSDILQNQIPIITIDDVLPMSFGFDVCIIDYNEEDGHKCGVMDVLIHKNSKYPTKGSGIYCQKLATASTATLMLYEGDDKQVKHNFFLTKLEIFNVPIRSEYECNNIMVELSINENGIANITAKTNNQIFTKQLPVQSNDGHLTKLQIQSLSKQVMAWFY